MRGRAIVPLVIASVTAQMAAGASSAAAQDGHRVLGDRVLVDRDSHWSAWRGATDLVEIVDGGLRPRLQRVGVNAALDAPSFSVTGPGGAMAPSAPASALHVIDGDTTSWGPDPLSPLRDWWIEVNLGRLVVARKVVVRFVDEDRGDPFLQFKVLGWRNGSPSVSSVAYTLTGTNIPRFWEIGRSDRPNKTRRVFEFEPRPTQESNAEFVGDALSHIRVIAFASDSSQAQRVDSTRFAGLPPALQGKIEYYRRERSGLETRVSAADYGRIGAERRGTVRYYRREIPRIAEIEVLTAGDNVNLGLLERSGSAFIGTQKEPRDVTATIADGDYRTAYEGPIFGDRQYEFVEDLGAVFWVETMHFLNDGPQPIDRFTLDVSDGRRAPDGTILWTRAGDSSVEGMFEETGGSAAPLSASAGVRFREFRVAPQPVRFLRGNFRNPLRPLSNIGINEVMVYGVGFVPEVVLTSDLIHFDRPKNLVTVDWDGDTPEGTAIRLQTRTGNELDQDTLYFDTNGVAKTASQYGRLPASKQGEIRYRARPGDDWSPWSLPYTESGQAITSPSPRQYAQLRLAIATNRAGAAATLRALALRLSEPVASGLIGEVDPVRVEIATSEVFRYYLRPDFTSAAQGFDEIAITATGGARMEALTGLGYGSREALAAGGATELAAADLAVTATGADSLQFRLPHRIGPGTALVEIRFRATLYGNSASFRAFVRDGSATVAWQRVDEGDATDLAGSSTVTVLSTGTQVITGLLTDTHVVTPNGDGVHDEVEFRFAVARLSTRTPVRLEIHDLAGRLMRRVEEQRADPRGSYAWRWDGTDPEGRVVPPGLYLARVHVETDARQGGRSSAQRVVRVAY